MNPAIVITLDAAIALTLIYVLSAIATFWFVRDRAKWRGVKFIAGYAL